MDGRRVLVIACNDSQRQLGFIPKLPTEFFALMTDPNFGNCRGATRAPLINVNREEAIEAIADAFRAAAEDRDHLILYLLGHGVNGASGTYYFGESPQAGVDLASDIRRMLDTFPKPPTLALILDTCHSGSGTIQTAEVCNGLTQFATLAAVTGGLTYGGDFTGALIKLMTDECTEGDSGTISLESAADYAAAKLRDRERTHYSNGKQGGRSVPYLSRNPAYNGLGGRTLPSGFQETAALRQIEDGLRQVNVVHVTGPFGSGKTTLAVALTTLHGPRGTKNPGFIHATAFLTPNTTIGILADQLCSQLATAFGPFRESLKRVEEVPRQALEARNPLQSRVLQPLVGMQTTSTVRILIDGFGEPSGADEDEIRLFVRDLCQMPRVRLVVFGERGRALPGAGARPIDITFADESDLSGMLNARGIQDPQAIRAILEKGRRNWHLTSLLSALAANGVITDSKISEGLNDYSRMLLERLEDQNIRWQSHMAPVLGLVALAGKGPALPIELLVNASARLGGPSTSANVQAVLDRLGELVERSDPGRETELCGLAVPELAAYLFKEATGIYVLDRARFESALVDSIEELAPRKAMWRSRTGAYAWKREAEHLASLKHPSLLDSLRMRDSRYLAEDLNRWQYWLRTFLDETGTSSLPSLFAGFQVRRIELETLLRQPQEDSGRPGKIRASEGALEDAYNRLKRAHPGTRGALWAGVDWCTRGPALHSWRSALELALQLDTEARRLLPDDDFVRQQVEGYVLVYRKEANSSGEDTGRLLGELQALLARVEKSAGAKSLLFLDLTVFQAALIGETDADRALGILQEVLQLQRTLTADDDGSILTTRHNIVAYRMRSPQEGQLELAYREVRKLVEDQILYFGRDHFDSIQTRLLAATLGYIHEFQPTAAILADLDALLADARVALEPGHEFLTRIESWRAVASAEIQPGEAAQSECVRCLLELKRVNITAPTLIAKLEACAGTAVATERAGA